MPTYEYECGQCDHAFELLQSMKDDPLKDCPSCHGQGTVKRLIGAGAGLIFKGSGFYITDYKNAGDAKSGSAAKADGKAESKNESKGEGKSEAKSEGKADSGAAVKTETKSESKSETKSTPAPAPKSSGGGE